MTTKTSDFQPITGVARTITDVAGISAPEQAGPAINSLKSAAETAFQGKSADKIIMYNPDAVGLWLFHKYPERFGEAVRRSDVRLPLLSVMPCVTPVCFASMYTGAKPDVHGIQSYEKPVLKTDTVFDAFLRAGKKAAIVSTKGDSISRIFLERDMDYFIYSTVGKCNKKALALIEEDAHDLIVLYNRDFDAAMHRSGPESRKSLRALKRNVAVFGTLMSHAERHWRGRRTMIGFCPDHGCHAIDGGLGSHGLDVPEDMNVIHFFRFI